MTMEQFHWTSPDGVEIVLPRLNRLKAGLLRKVRNLNDVDAMFTILESVADKKTLEKVDELELVDLDALNKAWQEDVTPGESSGSST